MGNIIYEENSLKRIMTDNGYIEGGIYYFYVKDHLGNNRIVANQSAGVIQSNQYYPFGMLFAESTNQDKQDFKYNGKELDQMHGLNQYDYSARYYDPAISRFTTIDPLAEKYYSISPYVYVANNPLKFIDPDGRDIWIYYKTSENKSMAFIFNGSNHKKAPNNTFVKQFITAYDYNINNGGGDNLKAAAEDRTTISRIVESTNGKSSREHRKVGKGMKSFVVWNSLGGIETTDGKKLSPATVLEHEMAHERNYDTNTAEHNKNSDSVKGYDKQYETKEERRVITGAEAKTARANKEVPNNYTRPNHRGTRFKAISPISNKRKDWDESN